ncbi:MAG: nucleotidyl transferase AbiEii/AbiGii toxin family protein [Aquabacterium sp.]|uniref:nucleotidyl transferase AbiEii/AbiGii toxin family protein n=1 Tax=Aquabacterium sp. TaxID=1872578 RepID=UPI0025C0F2EE|nr:nucleotidyl transferase AbiEii/AbiGii toxin family protein [Aquabacterium sp.]MBI3384045.1 nucleotidyl transferase AbiEii/AbiGii toxin family protein [Aquabacterium sp.]
MGQGQAAETADGEKLDKIKRLAVVAMVSDDDLLDQLVLKGGNAMDLIHKVSSRASVDLDFSMADDFEGDIETVRTTIEGTLRTTFANEGYFAFDVRMTKKPGNLSDELKSFWGGYSINFKLIATERANSLNFDLRQMQREAVQLGEGTKFEIDVSPHEYTEDKLRTKLEGYALYVYTPEMIVCEKLRAICQQTPDYAKIVRSMVRNRARDFVDIEVLINNCNVDLGSPSAHRIIKEMFKIKKVPLNFLIRIEEMRHLHKEGFAQVQATVKADKELQTFDYYFDFVQSKVQLLEPIWNE